MYEEEDVYWDDNYGDYDRSRASKKPRLENSYDQPQIIDDDTDVESETSASPDIVDVNSSPAISSPAISSPVWPSQASKPNVCIGVLTQATFRPYKSSRSYIPRTTFQVALSPLGSQVAVHEIGSKRMLGELGSTTGQSLSHFMYQMNIEFEAFVQDEETAVQGENTDVRSVKIYVYVVEDDMEQFGHNMTKRGLHLQHPTLTDTIHKPYRNPQHWSLRGTPFPDLRQIMQSLDDCNPEDDDFSQHHNRRGSQKLTLFDTAQGPTHFTPVKISDLLKATLKQHQVKAVSMMVEKEKGLVENPDFPAMWERRAAGNHTTYRNIITNQIKEKPRVSLGGLLADDMGLGKTLSVVALIATTIDVARSIRAASQVDDFDLSSFGLSVTLVVAPKTTIAGWVRQLEEHVKKGRINVCQYYGRDRSKKLQAGSQNYDVILTTYGVVAKEHAASMKHENRDSPLFSTQWFRVVFDEAHFLRNTTTKLYKAALALRSERTWLVTGTPIQNSIQDFESVVQLTRCSPFDNPGTFQYEIAGRIKNNDKNGFKHLRTLIKCLSLRRTKEILDLPPKTPREEKIELSPEERKLYDRMSDKLLEQIDRELAKGINRSSLAHVMEQILRLRQICNHGRELLPKELVKSIDTQNQEIWYTEQADHLVQCEICGKFVAAEEILTEIECGHIICGKCPKRLQEEQPELETACPICSRGADDVGKQNISPTGSTIQAGDFQPSSKVLRLIENLRQIDGSSSADRPNKSVVFSEWTSMLSVVEISLKREGFDFARIDGQMKAKEWRDQLKRFSIEKSCTVLLASIRNAGTGIDILVANHVHLLESQWNPMVEEQALDRVHRLGQTRPVTTYRYVVQNSIEQKGFAIRHALLRYSNSVHLPQAVARHTAKALVNITLHPHSLPETGSPSNMAKYVQQKQAHKLALISASLDAHKDDKKLTIAQKLMDIRQFFRNDQAEGDTPIQNGP